MPTSVDECPNAGGVDLANWRTAPFSRWAFHNVREIIPTVDVATAPGRALPLPKAPQPLGAFELATGDGSSLDLEGFLSATATDGIVVLHNGRIAFETYANGTTRQTPHILFSATKSVLSLVMGIVQRTGALDVDRLASDFAPEIAHTVYAGANIRHLLDMRTGVTMSERQERDYGTSSNWRPIAPGEARMGLHGFIETLTGPGGPHGGSFRYVSTNADLLGWLLERATGRPFAELLSALLWRPLGAEHDAYITVDCEGAPRTTGGLCATVRDLARIGLLMANDGRRDGVEIIPATWIDDIAENGDRAAWRDGEWGETFAPISRAICYRSGWYVVNEEPQILFAMGIHGQNLFVDRANKVVIAKASSQARNDYAALALTYRAVSEFRRRLIADAS